ncbi:uncharacterized protein LOC132846167 [Tachysurus vachellii]|uniref:uncharacterized protein LOC132846167 n=1 Tax=Tachysurus vachellii TaxID=175792 RepID=UPI00296B18BD|nr:uncharacterized protein LOC132846167 [Tachysurus vachellii]
MFYILFPVLRSVLSSVSVDLKEKRRYSTQQQVVPEKQRIHIHMKIKASMGLMALGFAPDGFSTVTDDPKQGDLFMVKCGSSSGGSATGYYHAGVYCSEEDEEIIHFTNSSSQSSSSWSNSSSGPGIISKVHVKNFCGENKVLIYRKNEGIPENTFRNKVKKAMQKEMEYNVLDCNCIHFALELLDVDTQGIDDYIKRMGKIIKNISKSQEMQPLPV